MKKTGWATIVLIIACGVSAAVRTSSSFRLLATPAEVTKGSTVTLIADKLPPSSLTGHIRYTFLAQRNWPCQESFVIAEDTNSSKVSWTPTKNGIYTLTAIAKNFPKGAVTGTQVGSASTSNYKVRPNNASLEMIGIFSPATGGIAPVNIAVIGKFQSTLNPNLPIVAGAALMQSRFKIDCAGGCSPSTCTKEGSGVATSCNFQLANPGNYTFTITGDLWVPPIAGCEWTSTGTVRNLVFSVTPP